METIDPLWIGAGGTAMAMAVFLNGYRLFQEDGERRRMGQFHMVLAPAFVVMLFAVLHLNGAV